MKAIYWLLLLALLTNGAAAQPGITGKGPVVEETIELPPFESIGLAIEAKVFLRQGKQQKVRIKAQKNIIDNIEQKVKDNAWGISFKEEARRYDPVEIYVTMADIRNLSVAGSGSIICAEAFSELRQLDLAIGGSGKIEMLGDAGRMKISLAGSGVFAGADLKTQQAEVNVAGSGTAEVHAEEQLKVSIAGSGDVYYYGSPRVESSIAGSGKVRARQ